MSSAESLIQSFSPEADQRLHGRHPVRRSPRLSISMSSCLQWLQRSMPNDGAIRKSVIAPLGGRRCHRPFRAKRRRWRSDRPKAVASAGAIYVAVPETRKPRPNSPGLA